MSLVWVLEEGAYDTRDIVGVFATRKEAQAAATDNPPRWKKWDDGRVWWNRSLDYEAIAWVTEAPFGARLEAVRGESLEAA